MKLNKLSLLIFVLSFSVSFFSAAQVLAVGGGGGGGGGGCSNDTWSCSDWSPCSTAGQQTRACSLVFDCPSVNDPKPAETQSCTPPVTPPAPAPAPTPTPNPSPNPSPTKTPSPATNCTKTTWQCGNWSKTCDIFGNQSRNCQVVNACPQQPTASPSTTQRCDHLQCGDKTALRDRISCRLNLAPAGVARELEIQYLPEECRSLSSKSDQETCEERYKSYKPCWNIPAGQARLDCARGILMLGPVISQEIETCQGKSGTGRVACIAGVKEKVFSMIKFRFYDLEQRAEKMGELGADLGAVTDLETTIEQSKQNFNKVTTYQER